MMTASMDVPDVMYSMGQIALAVQVGLNHVLHSLFVFVWDCILLLYMQEILSRCMDSRPADPKDLVDVRVMVHIMDDQMKLSCKSCGNHVTVTWFYSNILPLLCRWVCYA